MVRKEWGSGPQVHWLSMAPWAVRGHCGAMEGTQIKSLGVLLEPSLSLLLPSGGKTLPSFQPGF